MCRARRIVILEEDEEEQELLDGEVSAEVHFRPTKRSRIGRFDADKPRLGLRWQRRLQEDSPLGKPESVSHDHTAQFLTDASTPRAFRRRLRSGTIDLTSAAEDAYLTPDGFRDQSDSTNGQASVVSKEESEATLNSHRSVAELEHNEIPEDVDELALQMAALFERRGCPRELAERIACEARSARLSTSRFRSLFWNYKSNDALRTSLLSGCVSPRSFVQMDTEELAREELQHERRQQRSDALKVAKMKDDSTFPTECPSCGDEAQGVCVMFSAHHSGQQSWAECGRHFMRGACQHCGHVWVDGM